MIYESKSQCLLIDMKWYHTLCNNNKESTIESFNFFHYDLLKGNNIQWKSFS